MRGEGCEALWERTDQKQTLVCILREIPMSIKFTTEGPSNFFLVFLSCTNSEFREWYGHVCLYICMCIYIYVQASPFFMYPGVIPKLGSWKFRVDTYLYDRCHPVIPVFTESHSLFHGSLHFHTPQSQKPSEICRWPRVARNTLPTHESYIHRYNGRHPLNQVKGFVAET